jgi:hypothetical protein
MPPGATETKLPARHNSERQLTPLKPITSIGLWNWCQLKCLTMYPIKCQCQTLAPAPVPCPPSANSLRPLWPHIFSLPCSPMCYFGFARLWFACGHVIPIQLEWMVSPCKDTGCHMHPLHPQPCNECLNTCYTNLNVDSHWIIACAGWACNPCHRCWAQLEGCTTLTPHWHQDQLWFLHYWF